METQEIMSFGIISSADRKTSRRVFEQLINETVDEVFSSLGDVCRQAIYDSLERKYKLKKSDIADHTMEFSEALEGIFGNAAALLELRIIRKLHRKVPQFKHLLEGTLTFPDYVHALSQFFNNC